MGGLLACGVEECFGLCLIGLQIAVLLVLVGCALQFGTCEILLCDEPTGALDSETGVMVLKLLLKMAREYGKTIVIVTHNQNIARMADVVVRVKNGRIQSCVEQNEPAAADDIDW